MMSRKEYVKVADILADVSKTIHPEVMETLVEKFSDMFFEDNHNFSPTRFESACYKELV
jgi:hypothetical protein